MSCWFFPNRSLTGTAFLVLASALLLIRPSQAAGWQGSGQPIPPRQDAPQQDAAGSGATAPVQQTIGDVDQPTAETPALSAGIDFDRSKVFGEIVDVIRERFVYPERVGHVWTETATVWRERAVNATTRDEFAAAVNGLLDTLEISHTRYFSKLEPRRYQLLGVFHALYEDQDPASLFLYDGIGIETQVVDGQHVVSSVFDGMPAKQAGIRFGDRLLTVDGQPFHPTLSFNGKAGQSVQIDLERGGQRMSLSVPVVQHDGRTMFDKALKASQQVLTQGEHRIGYLHAWSYAGRNYHEFVQGAVLAPPLSECDALILDLRDGWGGASIEYLNLFRPPIAELVFQPRGAEPDTFDTTWTKPVALLINGRSTSGKELIAYGFKKLKLGPIVGENTAGAVVGGSPFLISNGDLLYLAVSSVTIDGQVLEGVGVAPDVPVPRPLESEGDAGDPQLNAAVRELARRLGGG